MRSLFREANQFSDLDQMRKDVATYLDSPTDARSALRRIKPEFFISGFAIAQLLTEVDEALDDYFDDGLKAYYRKRIERFIERHQLPYRLDLNPLKLTLLLTGEIETLYQALDSKAAANEAIREALIAFEHAWERQSTEWSPINAKAAIRQAVLLAENMLVAADGRANEFYQALQNMRRENRFPSNDFANIFDRAYTFANTYPNIRHGGDARLVKRELRKEDIMLSALVFFGLSACAHDLYAEQQA